jgi:hypothetical protein
VSRRKRSHTMALLSDHQYCFVTSLWSMCHGFQCTPCDIENGLCMLVSMDSQKNFKKRTECECILQGQPCPKTKIAVIYLGGRLQSIFNDCENQPVLMEYFCVVVHSLALQYTFSYFEFCFLTRELFFILVSFLLF